MNLKPSINLKNKINQIITNYKITLKRINNFGHKNDMLVKNMKKPEIIVISNSNKTSDKLILPRLAESANISSPKYNQILNKLNM